MSDRLQTGQSAPDFSLPAVDGGTWSLAEHRGHRVVVYFYPKASTPGCTTEACDFRDNVASLTGAGYDVVGISPDGVEDLATFRDEQGLDFPLLSDANHTTLEAYGAWDGKVDRSTFVVDADGTLVSAEYGVQATGHVKRLRVELGIDAPA